MDKTTINAVETLIKQLKESFNDYKGLYLYGSQARGTFTSDSDIDIVAVFDFVDRNKRMDIWGIVGKIEAELDVFIDLHPMTKEELERNPIYYDQVVNNGKFYKANDKSIQPSDYFGFMNNKKIDIYEESKNLRNEWERDYE